MLTLFIAVAIVGLSLAYYWSTFGKYQKQINKVPGPPTLPLVGNAHMVGKNPHDILQNLLKWWREYDKDKFRIWIGLAANIVITDPKDIENILTSTQILRKSIIYNLLHPWLGQGLLTSFGQRWHSHRKMITPSFHFKILVDFLDVMSKNSKKFVEKLREKSKDGSIVDIQALVCYGTLDVISETAMGVSINAMDENDSDIVKAFQYMCYSVQMRSFSPLKRNDFLFKFAPEYGLYKNALDTLEKFTMDIISNRRDAMESDDKNKKSGGSDEAKEFVRPKQAFLDTLLTTSIGGNRLTLHEVYEEVSTFMFEGHDTTSSGISFAVYLLSRHPEVQERVFKEQMDILSGDLTRAPTYSQIQDMKYLDMVIKEAQRLYPSVPIIGRYTDAPYDLNGTIIPKGATINLFIVGMGYNEKYFPDPYKFDPERFNPETRVKANPFEYVPFSAGPRNCIGQKFAMMEMKCMVSKIVQQFEILPPVDGLISKDGYEPKEPQNQYDPILSAVLTLKSDNGLKIRLKPRNL